MHDTVALIRPDIAWVYVYSKLCSPETATCSCSSVDGQILRVPKVEDLS